MDAATAALAAAFVPSSLTLPVSGVPCGQHICRTPQQQHARSARARAVLRMAESKNKSGGGNKKQQDAGDTAVEQSMQPATAASPKPAEQPIATNITPLDALRTEKPVRSASINVIPAPIEYKPPKATFFDLVLSRTADTVEDIKLHVVRKYLPKKTLLGPLRTSKSRIIVLGCGWAGHAFVKTIDTTKYDVVVVSPRNYFLFTPMLASSAVGTVEFRSICESIRAANEFVDYYEATCTNIDVVNRKISCVNAQGEVFDLEYAHLVMTVGASTNTFGTPGVEQYCYFLKDIDDARGLRRAIVNQFELANLPGVSDEERARRLTFVVVGGGPTGCEFSAELSDFLKQDLKKHYPKLFADVSVKLLNAGESILTQFDSALQKDALKNLKEGKIDVILNARVVRVNENTIELQTGEVLPYGLAVWAGGNGTRPLVDKLIKALPEQAEAKGRIMTDSWQRVKGTDSVFAIGDCAIDVGRPLPATGQVAAQQGSYVARLLNRNACLKCEIPVMLPTNIPNTVSKEELEKLQKGMKLKFAKPFEFLSLGIMAYVGGSKAVADVDAGDIQVGNVSGRFAYFLWRSVYLTKQVSTRNRILVLFDWFKTRVFGRDISLF